MSATVLITGGGSGLGFELAKVLANYPEKIGKVVITCRSEKSAKNALSQLGAATSKKCSETELSASSSTADDWFYSYILMDLSDIKSIASAVVRIPSSPANFFDRLLLNAGGLGQNESHKSGNGATDSMTINTLGHGYFIDELIKSKRISDSTETVSGCRIIYVGSEVTRKIWAFDGLLPSYWPCGPGYFDCITRGCGGPSKSFNENDVEWAITTQYNGCCHCIPIRKQLGNYKNAKIVGHQFFANLGKEFGDESKIRVISMSPGGAGGSFAGAGHFPLKPILTYTPCLMRALCVTHACSSNAAVEIGVMRYVDVILPEDKDFKWNQSSMPMS